MATRIDYITKRGDTITCAVWFPNADLTDSVIRATLKRKLDDRSDDTRAAWKKDLDCNSVDVCDDPTSGIAYITITGDPEDSDGSTYDLRPDTVYVLDVQVDLSSYPAGQGRRTTQARIKVVRDGTRRNP